MFWILGVGFITYVFFTESIAAPFWVKCLMYAFAVFCVTFIIGVISAVDEM